MSMHPNLAAAVKEVESYIQKGIDNDRAVRITISNADLSEAQKHALIMLFADSYIK